MIEDKGLAAVSEELDDVRAKLEARHAGCYDRIEDAVAELLALHGADGERIVEFVRSTVDRELRPEGSAPST